MSALRYIAFKHYSIDGCVTVEQEEAVLDLVLRAEAGRCLPRRGGYIVASYNASACHPAGMHEIRDADGQLIGTLPVDTHYHGTQETARWRPTGHGTVASQPA